MVVNLKKHEEGDGFKISFTPGQLWKVITIAVGVLGFLAQFEYFLITYSMKINNTEEKLKDVMKDNNKDHECYENAFISHGINPYSYTTRGGNSSR